MAYYSLILLVFIFGGLLAFVLARFIERTFDRIESVPLTLRLFFAFLILAVISITIEVFLSDAGLPVAMAFSIGFFIVLSIYELLFSNGEKN